MATELPISNGTNGHSHTNGDTSSASSFAIKAGLARMLKGGVIMDVVNAEQVHATHNFCSTNIPITDNPTSNQARIAEEAGAVAVMALERVPADIRAQGGVARMSDPALIKEIMEAVTIPVMAKARIGHFVECQVHTERHILGLYSPSNAPTIDSSKPTPDPTSPRRRLH